MESNTNARLSRDSVVWLYRVLLGRDPESEEIIMNALQAPSFDELRRSIVRSSEFQSHFSAGHEQPAPYGFQNTGSLRADVVWHSRLAGPEVDLAYNAILRRDLSDDKIRAAHVSRHLNLFELVHELLSSDEFTDRMQRTFLLDSLTAQSQTKRQLATASLPRVLAFGAYLNGNAGDFCQVHAVDALLRHIFAKTQPINLFGCSWEHKIDVPTNIPLLPRTRILDLDLLQKMDLIVIGGGGLLSTPHFPLYETGWVEALIASGTPYAIVGVGASSTELDDPARAPGYRLLISNAFHVSGRDTTSIEALRDIRQDACWVPDPFLSNRSVSVQPAGERPTAPTREVILVPKFPINDTENLSLFYLKALESKLHAQGIATKAVLMEPALDQDMTVTFENIVYATNEHEFIDSIQASEHVYTMRYHGAIFSLSSGIPCSTFPVPKIKELFEEIGLASRIIDPNSDIATQTDYSSSEWACFANFMTRARHSVEGMKSILTAPHELSGRLNL
ncbi:polysaccharide pyruvyl transferase family protein [Burkholderia cepacia]|uniref:polysaccharide pyruvyl transferase family protein n=1 Tax=Burkholderia cepacia TaxID=292 RepID=UPI000A4938A7|nr:polysaccharide pyruvyl transferase family protein [Burkholderia cepacia]